MDDNIEPVVETEVEAITEAPAVEETLAPVDEVFDPSKSFHDRDEVKPEAEPEDAEAKAAAENKPWMNKERKQTPKWAIDRFKQQSTTIQELKKQNAEFMAAMKELGVGQEPGTPEVYKRTDFPDDDSYEAYKDELLESKFNAKIQAYEAQRNTQDTQRAEQARLQSIEQTNVEKAKATHLTDYDEVMHDMSEEIAANPDLDVRLPIDLLNKISQSELGPFIKYGIASNAGGIRDQLISASESDKVQIVNKLANDYAKSLQGQAAPAVPQAQATTVVQAAPRTPARKAPPKAPPAVKPGKEVNISSLTGDEYVRARNKQLNKR